MQNSGVILDGFSGDLVKSLFTTFFKTIKVVFFKTKEYYKHNLLRLIINPFLVGLALTDVPKSAGVGWGGANPPARWFLWPCYLWHMMVKVIIAKHVKKSWLKSYYSPTNLLTSQLMPLI